MERKLAAILAADVAGYSRLMGADEEGRFDALRASREVIDKIVAAHRGRIYNTAGDSVVAEFAGAVEAINTAVEIRREMARRNEPLHVARHYHGRQCLIRHLAEPEEGPGPRRRRCRGKEEGRPHRLARLTHQHHAVDSHALLHGRPEAALNLSGHSPMHRGVSAIVLGSETVKVLTHRRFPVI
jgi:hypothetical protein